VGAANAYWVLAVNKNSQIQPLSSLQDHRLAIPYSTVLVGKPTVPQPVKKFPMFYGT